jgi:hypothetical protein
MLNPEYRFLYDFDRNGRINGVETGRPLPATSAALTHSGPHLPVLNPSFSSASLTFHPNFFSSP